MTRKMLMILWAAGLLVTSTRWPAYAYKGRPDSEHVAISLGDGNSVEGKKPSGLNSTATRGRKFEVLINDFSHKPANMIGVTRM